MRTLLCDMKAFPRQMLINLIPADGALSLRHPRVPSCTFYRPARPPHSAAALSFSLSSRPCPLHAAQLPSRCMLGHLFALATTPSKQAQFPSAVGGSRLIVMCACYHTLPLTVHPHPHTRQLTPGRCLAPSTGVYAFTVPCRARLFARAGCEPPFCCHASKQAAPTSRVLLLSPRLASAFI
ncbi:hypothetical protein B0H19DRAFT_1379173 [Mycena capillaripes]|nr:hypothetical protein B0H19DRAFT_1379173 [Mycena capillaripes]